jgi:hypothetical protein
MVQSFAPALEQRLAGMALPAAARQAVEGERTKLGGATIPGELPEQTRKSLRAAIDESFMIAFRRVMLIGSALALASAGTAFLLIRPNEQKSQ